MVLQKKLWKKGGIHVDWAISMGLFLVYVILLFIILKPGSYAIHKPESLFTIIENTFNNNTQISIREVLFSAGACHDDDVIKLEENKRNYRFSEIKIFKSGTFTVLANDRGQNEVGISFGGSDITINCGNADDKYEKWSTNPNGKPRLFLATAYPKDLRNYEDVDYSPQFIASCSVKDPNKKPTCDLTTKLGTITEYTGYYQEYLEKIADKANNFEQLKKDWGFPENSYFRINIKRTYPNPDDDTNPNIEIFDRLNPEAPEGVNVFIKEFDAVLLNKHNEREKIRINILAW